jgi:hypothetical protein
LLGLNISIRLAVEKLPQYAVRVWNCEMNLWNRRQENGAGWYPSDWGVF